MPCRPYVIYQSPLLLCALHVVPTMVSPALQTASWQEGKGNPAQGVAQQDKDVSVRSRATCWQFCSTNINCPTVASNSTETGLQAILHTLHGNLLITFVRVEAENYLSLGKNIRMVLTNRPSLTMLLSSLTWGYVPSPLRHNHNHHNFRLYDSNNDSPTSSPFLFVQHNANLKPP